MATPDQPQYTYSLAPSETAARPGEGGSSSNASMALLVAAGLLIPGLIAYGLGTLNELQVLGIVLALLGVAAIVARPFVGLILFIMLLYIRPEEAIPALAGMHFTLLVAVVTLGGMSVQMLLDKQKPIRTPMNGMILCFGLAVVLSSMQAGNVLPAFQDIGRLVLIVLLIINLTRTQKRYDVLVTSLILVTTYLAAYSVYLFQTGNFIREGGEIRSLATGIFSDPNDLASTFTAGMAFTVMRVIQTRSYVRAGYVCLLGVMLYATIATQSRGGMIAMVVLIAGYLIAAKIPLHTKIAIAVACLVPLLAVSGGHMSNFDTQEDSANSRFWFWDNGVNILMWHPVLGLGYSQFNSENGGMTAHNTFVVCFAELGLVGYYFFIGAIYFCFKPRPKETAAPGVISVEAQNLFGARMGLVTYLAASFWLSHTYVPVLYVLLALPIAAQLNMKSAAPPETDSSPFAWRDYRWIGAFALGSILFIKLMADHYK